MSTWSDGITPASFDVACGGEIHQLIWRDGELLIPAHQDPEAERALAGLGGEPCRCVDLLDAWTACVTDPRVLVLGPRGSDALPAWPDSPSRRARLARSGVDPLSTVLSLGDRLPRRLVATVAHALAGQDVHPALFPMLHLAVSSRVRTSVHRWQPRARPEVILEMIPEGAQRALTGSLEASIVARLPLGWITEVWARDLAVVSGHFTLAAECAESAEGTEWRCHTVDSALAPRTDWFMSG